MGHSILLCNASYLNWWFSPSSLGREEVRPRSLVRCRNTDKIYLVGAKGKSQRGGQAQGRALSWKDTKKLVCGWGKRLLEATENLAGRSLGTVARLDRSPLAGWLWVYFPRCEMVVAVSDLDINRAQLHSGSLSVITTFRGLYTSWKMSLAALSTITYMQLDKYTAFRYQSIWSILCKIWYAYLGRYSSMSVSFQII